MSPSLLAHVVIILPIPGLPFSAVEVPCWYFSDAMFDAICFKYCVLPAKSDFHLQLDLSPKTCFI